MSVERGTGTNGGSPPAQLGAITNGHLMKIGGPWTTTVEPLFSDADSNLPRVIERLEKLPHRPAGAGISFESRFTAHDVDRNERNSLGEGLASLLIRCPAPRNLLHLTVQRINGEFGVQAQEKHDDSLIAGNIHQHYSQMVASLRGRGKLVFLRCVERELVMGEGYLSTLAGYTVQLQYHCLLPLTPNLAVLAFSPQACTSFPEAGSIALTSREIDLINDVTQIYSRDYIFYRREAPRILPEFQRREFMELTLHKQAWLDSLMQFVSWHLRTFQIP